jgi:K+-sensing histidine kinase KdpD
MSDNQTTHSALEADLRRRHQELDAITTMVETVASTLDLDEVVNRILNSVMSVLGVSGGGIYLRDEQHELRQAVVQGLASGTGGGVASLDEALGLANDVVRTGPVRTRLAAGAGGSANGTQSGSLAGAPLHSKGTIVGVIVVANSQARPLDESDISLLARLARHAGMAVSNASLYRDLQKAYQALQSAQEQLVDAERNKIAMQMAGATAHELNQPLTVVVGYSSILARTVNPDDSKYAIIEKIERNAQKMNEIVKRLGQLTQYKTREYLHGEEIVDIREAEG